MKYLLKIDKKFWDMIAQGHKTKEYRKLNKRHIKQGDTIVFCDLDSKEVYGEVRVKEVNILTLLEAKGIIKIDIDSLEFICKNYNEQEYILEFVLESIKTPR
jgi:ASC-1-like (ASCH) protein